jgi:hypothetical protein
MMAYKRLPSSTHAGATFILENASVDDLETLLPGLDGFVWINQHMPHPTVSWWQATVQLSPYAEPCPLSVRNVAFDLQMSVSEFMAVIDNFREGGIGLVVSDRPMPDTLRLDQLLFERGGYKALVQNGAKIAFGLPHRGETAQLEVYNDEDVRLMSGRLERCLK